MGGAVNAGGTDTVRASVGYTLNGGSGNNTLNGFVFNNSSGSDTLSDFVRGLDKLAFSQPSLKVGRRQPGRRRHAARLAVRLLAQRGTGHVQRANVVSFSTSAAASAIASATSAYATGRTALFALDSGASCGVYLFASADGNAAVPAGEITLLATRSGTPATAAADNVFMQSPPPAAQVGLVSHRQGGGNALIDGGTLAIERDHRSRRTDMAIKTGTSGNDVLQGTSMNDTIRALGGIDLIHGSDGFDTIRGDAGYDTVSYANWTSSVEATLPESSFGMVFKLKVGTSSLDMLYEVEALNGTSYNDKITGSTLQNRLDGGGGNDDIQGGAGNDTLLGGAGNDKLQGDVYGSGGEVAGRFGSDMLYGGAGNDTLYGAGGNDTLNGGTGADTMVGGSGNDSYYVDHTRDRVFETPDVGSRNDAGGIDTVRASISHALGSYVEKLVLTGNDAINGTGNTLANAISGNAAANKLSGGNGNDTLNGFGGNDTLVGGAGSDRLTGGSGPDRFVFNSKSGSDTITDFARGLDKLGFSQAALKVGDGDSLVEGAALRAAPGGFSASSELVIFSANAVSFSTSAAAAAIGSATSACAIGKTALFALDNGASSAVYLFRSADGNAAVSAGELTLLATLSGTAATAVADYVFMA